MNGRKNPIVRPAVRTLPVLWLPAKYLFISLAVLVVLLGLGGSSPVKAGTGNVLSNPDFSACAGGPSVPSRWTNTGNVNWVCDGTSVLKATITNGATQVAVLTQCSALSVFATVEDWTTLVIDNGSDAGGYYSVYFYDTADCTGLPQAELTTLPFDFTGNGGTFAFQTKSVSLDIFCDPGEGSATCMVSSASVDNAAATPVRLTGLEARPAGGLAAWLQRVLRWMINPLGW